MLGPVYTLEWMQATRRVHTFPWRSIYAIVLFVEMQWLTVKVVDSLITGDKRLVSYVAEALLWIVAAQQSLLILVVAPTFAAGSITDEKRRGTLDFLLITPLHSVEIIIGKWLGQATRVVYLVMPGWILLMLLAGLVGETEQPVAFVIADQVVLIYSITAIALLVSVLSRSTPWAIISVYAMLGVSAALEWLVARPTFGASIWATPLGIKFSQHDRMVGLAWLTALAPICLAGATWRLRASHERQQTARQPVLGRWWDRPAIADTPLRWKERHIGDWMSIPIWSAMPAWLRYACVIGVLALIVGTFANATAVIVLAISQFLGSALFVGIRAAGSITSERERQTWDSLLVTRMDARQLLRGKLWGHIDAVRPYQLCYILPVAIAAAMEEPWLFVGILYAWLASWVVLFYFGAIGITVSVTATSTWRSILATLVNSVASLAMLQIGLSSFVAFLWIGLATLLIPAPFQMTVVGISLALSPIPILLVLSASAEERLEKAEQILIEVDHAGSR
jgi:hypothetical protein